MEERDYQVKAENAVIEALENGCHQQLVSMATGTGKTIVFSNLYKKLKPQLPGQMLVLAHREELVDQNIDKMRKVNPHIKVDKEMAGHKADPSTADVIVASVATLGRKGTKRTDAYNWEKLDKVITDEAHHSTADSYKNIYNIAGVLQPSTKKLLVGVTATPSRSDGKALAEIYRKIVYVYSMRQAIQDGWLVDVKGFRVNTDTKLDAVKTTAGDFQSDQLSEAVNTPQRNLNIVKAWLEKGDSRQTVAFTVDIQHAKDLAKEFANVGIKAEAIWGDDPDRAAKLQAHRDGEITVLCNCGVLVEGYDDWRISCIILARPTQSAVLFTQMVGRGTRLQEGTGNLKDPSKYTDGFFYPVIKQDCIVIDVVDSSSRHSLITLPTLMGMNGGLDLRGQSMVWAISELEKAQLEHDNVDFSKLKSIEDLKSFIESVNLFEVRFPEEVEQNSDLRWFKAVDGTYRLNVPKPKDSTTYTTGNVTIHQNMLDKWEINGYIKNRAFHGIRTSIEEAFLAADQQIRDRAPEALTLVNRTASWHNKPASVQQFQMLRRLYPGKQWPEDLTKGMASLWIDKKIGRKA